jgi:hypothetical protein
VGEPLRPVRAIARARGVGEPSRLPRDEVAVLVRRALEAFAALIALAAREAGVGLQEPGQEQPDARAVEDDVMEPQDDDVLVLGEPERGHPEQRPLIEAERLADL